MSMTKTRTTANANSALWSSALEMVKKLGLSAFVVANFAIYVIYTRVSGAQNAADSTSSPAVESKSPQASLTAGGAAPVSSRLSGAAGSGGAQPTSIPTAATAGQYRDGTYAG